MDVSSIGKELVSTVIKSAPLLGSALGGPAGTIIGSLISNTFGIDVKNSDDILSKMTSDPDYKIKLKQIEVQHEEFLKSLVVHNKELDLQNIQNARDYNLKVNDGVVHIIAIGYSGLFAVMFILTALKVVEIDDSIFINIFSIAMIIVNYYFGSSHKVKNSKNQ